METVPLDSHGFKSKKGASVSEDLGLFNCSARYMRSTIWSKYTERKKKRRVNFIPKFHSSLKKFVKYFAIITKRYMYGTKVPNFIGL